jgi:Mg2+ and Co2+ transporter CorA
MRQALSGQQLLAEEQWQYGYWVATVLILLSAALSAFLLYRSSWTYLNR